MRLRSALVPAVNIGSTLGWILIVAGLILRWVDLAWLGVLVMAFPVRDAAWRRMLVLPREEVQPHRAVWLEVMRRCDPDLVPAPASLFAYAAWSCGDTKLAGLALARALDQDPTYAMALDLRDCIAQGMRPQAERADHRDGRSLPDSESAVSRPAWGGRAQGGQAEADGQRTDGRGGSDRSGQLPRRARAARRRSSSRRVEADGNAEAADPRLGPLAATGPGHPPAVARGGAPLGRGPRADALLPVRPATGGESCCRSDSDGWGRWRMGVLSHCSPGAPPGEWAAPSSRRWPSVNRCWPECWTRRGGRPRIVVGSLELVSVPHGISLPWKCRQAAPDQWRRRRRIDSSPIATALRRRRRGRPSVLSRAAMTHLRDAARQSG
jgi:hypothetical protein